MNSNITPKQLIAVNLRYGVVANSLKILAFTDLSSKALFLSNRALSTTEIAHEVAQLIGIPSVTDELVLNSLRELRNNGQIKGANGKWVLEAKSRKNIEKEIESYQSALNKVIDKHFPKSVDKTKIFDWFPEAIVDFFTYNGDEWVKSVCKGNRQFSEFKTSDELIDGSLRKYRLEANASELKNAFTGFLASKDLDDQRYLTNAGFAMFSARLVAADVGADPITLDELKNSMFLLDTNFLFALQQEGCRRLSTSLKPLGVALNSIGAKLFFLRETKEEYARVWSSKRNEILKLCEVYPNKIIMDADDDFISTAKARGCANKEDFYRYFDSIREIPKEIPSGPTIELLEDEEIAKEINKAKKDYPLKQAIQNWRLKLRPWWDRQPKSNSALGHDASMLYVAELEKKSGKKIYILTLDRSFQLCCADRMSKHEVPMAIYLEGLIQILAINNAGPDLDATNFAPLLSSILIKRCVPPENMYTTQDLYWLFGIQKNVASFNSEKIKQIALEVNKARLSGKKANDETLQRTINRLYQEEIQSDHQKVEESVERAHKAEEAAEVEKNKRIEIENKFNKKEKEDKLRSAKWKLAKSLLWRIPVVLVCGGLMFVLASFAFRTLEKENLFSFGSSLLSVVVIGYGFLNRPIREYFNIKNGLLKNEK